MNETECSDKTIEHVFRSATTSPIPLLQERISCIREAGEILNTVCSSIPNLPPITHSNYPASPDPRPPNRLKGADQAKPSALRRHLPHLHLRSRRLRRRPRQHPRRQLLLFPRPSALRRQNRALLQKSSDPRCRSVGLLRRERIRVFRRHR